MSTAVLPAEAPAEPPTEVAPPPPADPRYWPKAVPLLVLAGLLAYCNTFTKAFVLDDTFWITGNADLAANPARYLSGFSRILVRASIVLNYKLGGLTPPGYHAFNLAVHILAGLTLYGLVRRVLLLPRFGERFAGRAPQLAFAVALLWLVHPLQTQAVTYVIQRAESMMGLFYLLTLYCWVRGATGGRSWYLLGLGSFVLSCGCKEIAVTLPPVLLAFDRVFLARSWRELARARWLPYLGVLVVAAVAVRPLLGLAAGEVAGIGGGAGASGVAATPFQYLLTESGVILHYLRLCFWPVGQSLDYLDWPVAKSVGDVLPQFLAVALLFAASVVLLFVRPPLGFLGVWFFFILAPTSSVVPIVDAAFEHRMYLPLAAVVAATVFAADGLIRRAKWSDSAKTAVGGGVLGAAALALIALTYARNETYTSPLSVWRNAAAARPNNPRPLASLAAVYQAVGELDEADKVLRRAETMDTPFNADFVRQRAAWYIARGELAKAEPLLKALTAGTFDANSPTQYRARVWVTLGLGRRAEAADLARALNTNRPGFAADQLMLAAVELAAGNEAAAKAAAAEAGRLDPKSPALAAAEARGSVLVRDSRTEAMTRPQALGLAEAACLADPSPSPVMFDTLAMARAWNGQFPQAVDAARKGIEAAEARGNADWAKALRERLKLYEAGKMYEAPTAPGKKP